MGTENKNMKNTIEFIKKLGEDCIDSDGKFHMDKLKEHKWMVHDISEHCRTSTMYKEAIEDVTKYSAAFRKKYTTLEKRIEFSFKIFMINFNTKPLPLPLHTLVTLWLPFIDEFLQELK